MYAWFLGYFVSALVGTALQKVAVPNGSMQAIATALTLYLVWFPLIPLGLRIFVFFARKRIDPNARWSAPIASASGDRAE